MDLPEAGNKHVVVFQDFLSKWPLVYPVPDQKAIRLARLLVEKVVPYQRHCSLTGEPIYSPTSWGMCVNFWGSAS